MEAKMEAEDLKSGAAGASLDQPQPPPRPSPSRHPHTRVCSTRGCSLSQKTRPPLRSCHLPI